MVVQIQRRETHAFAIDQGPRKDANHAKSSDCQGRVLFSSHVKHDLMDVI